MEQICPARFRNEPMLINSQVLISLYQGLDMILTLIDIAISEMTTQRYILIYRILAQVLIFVIFHSLIRKFEGTGVLNLITATKCICLILCWLETDYYLRSSTATIGHALSVGAQVMAILALSLINFQGRFLQYTVLGFSLIYGLFRYNFFIQDYAALVRYIGLHAAIVGFILYVYKESLPAQGIIQLTTTQNKQYSPIIQSERVKLQFRPPRSTQNIYTEQLATEKQSQPSEKDENLHQLVLKLNSQCGIYIIENLNTPIQELSSLMSHIVVKDKILSPKLIDNWITDSNESIIEPKQGMKSSISIYPQFNRSKQIKKFIQFIQTLTIDSQLAQEVDDPIQLQFFASNMRIRTLIEHLLAFATLQHQTFPLSKNILDFTLKSFAKQDNFYFSINLTPIVIQNKVQLLFYIYDLTEEPYLKQLMKYQNNTDNLIIDFSQAIKHPLNCTISMVEITMKSAPQQIQDQFLTPALSGCRLLLSHCNDMIDYVQIKKSGKLFLQYQDIQMKDFLIDILSMIKSQALFRGLELSIDLKNNVPLFVRLEPNRLRQILLNILSLLVSVIVSGKVHVECKKSRRSLDVLEISIIGTSNESRTVILRQIDKTMKILNAINLKNPDTYPDLTEKQLQQNILLSYYICIATFQVPLTFIAIKQNDQDTLTFTLELRNMNPNFQKQLNTKRQSAMAENLNFKQLYQNTDKNFHRVLSSQLTMFKQYKTDVPAIEIKEAENDISEQSSSSGSSKQPDEVSNSSFNSQDIKLQLEQFNRKPFIFIDGIKGDADEPQAPSNMLQVRQPAQAQLQRDSMTFGGTRSSLYSSMGFSQNQLLPNELMECYDKMEKIKIHKFKKDCECSRILISEDHDFDLYALSHQLEEIGISYEYVLQRELIIEKIKLNDKNKCCKGYSMIFISVDSIDDELIKMVTIIKDFATEHKLEYRLICLVGFQDEENRKQIRKLQFHDYLAKPIMIDALLFILAKWIKL